jgi:hypothetical protein
MTGKLIINNVPKVNKNSEKINIGSRNKSNNKSKILKSKKDWPKLKRKNSKNNEKGKQKNKYINKKSKKL